MNFQQLIWILFDSTCSSSVLTTNTTAYHTTRAGEATAPRRLWLFFDTLSLSLVECFHLPLDVAQVRPHPVA